MGVSGAAAFDKTHALARYIHVVKASQGKMSAELCASTTIAMWKMTSNRSPISTSEISTDRIHLRIGMFMSPRTAARMSTKIPIANNNQLEVFKGNGEARSQKISVAADRDRLSPQEMKTSICEPE